jgi:hypothetical protein
MPGWLLWMVVGIGAWFAASVPVGFLAGYLLTRQQAPRRRVVVLAGPQASRVRMRERSRRLTG